MKGFIKGLKELHQAGKKLVDEGKAIKAKELAEEEARLAKELAEEEARLAKDYAKLKDKERKQKIGNVRTFSSSNVEIRHNLGMVFCKKIAPPTYDEAGGLEKKVLAELKRQTFRRRGDAIINFRFDYTQVPRDDNDYYKIQLVGYGDAVKLKK